MIGHLKTQNYSKTLKNWGKPTSSMNSVAEGRSLLYEMGDSVSGNLSQVQILTWKILHFCLRPIEGFSLKQKTQNRTI
jgi:hypothetical protein